MSRIRIVLADDHPVVRAGIAGLLATQPDFEVVGDAANGKEAVALVEALRPDVLLVDLRMPVQDGVATIRALREERPGASKPPQVLVLVLTTYDTDADILRAVEAGATGYLLKDSPPDELFRAVRATAQGHSLLSPTVASRLVGHTRRPEPSALSARELEVLTRVAGGTINKIIARDLRISEATVKTHLLHIFAKLGVDDRTAAVTVALERGILRLGAQERQG
jgi:DNA-binding NarL/FixJ family response regulator